MIFSLPMNLSVSVQAGQRLKKSSTFQALHVSLTRVSSHVHFKPSVEDFLTNVAFIVLFTFKHGNSEAAFGIFIALLVFLPSMINFLVVIMFPSPLLVLFLDLFVVVIEIIVDLALKLVLGHINFSKIKILHFNDVLDVH